MNLPSPPTDNLYKFLCISALLAGVALHIWTEKRLDNLRQQQAELDIRAAISQARMDGISEDSKAFIEQQNRNVPKTTDRLNETLQEGMSLLQKSREEEVAHAGIAAEYENLSRSLDVAEKDLERQIPIMSTFFFLVFGVSGIAWYHMLQKHQDRLVKAQADAAEFDITSRRDAIARKTATDGAGAMQSLQESAPLPATPKPQSLAAGESSASSEPGGLPPSNHPD